MTVREYFKKKQENEISYYDDVTSKTGIEKTEPEGLITHNYWYPTGRCYLRYQTLDPTDDGYVAESKYGSSWLLEKWTDKKGDSMIVRIIRPFLSGPDKYLEYISKEK